jgi:tRNA threonylcarbamoyladenosine biosynthesis protein TsaE
MTLNQLLATWESGFFLPDLDSLQAAARAMTEKLPESANLTLALHGPMGAGKTSFVQALAREWGISGVVSSPTYNLLNVYRGPSRMLLHLDAWRLSPGDDLSVLMIDEIAREPWCLAIEWPSHVPSLCDGETIHLVLSHAAEGEAGRMLRFSARPPELASP